MNVGIVTIICRNYGNRLQNYALQECLKTLGVQVYTIPYRETNGATNIFKLLLKSGLAPIKNTYYSVCWEWFDSMIKWYPYTVESQNFDKNYFKYFVAGSDQIWNPYFHFNSNRELLEFAEPSQKVAYAASFGIKKLPENEINRFSEHLNTFKNISVRENEAAEIVQNCSERQAKVVLDPTMMLTSESWKKLTSKSGIRTKGKYVLKYFLGERDIENEQAIKEYAEKYHFDIIDITEPDKRLANKIGPIEFVHLINDCQCFFTDSFHGTVFSIILHKPFIVCERSYEIECQKMSSRLDTLLTTFGFMKRRLTKLNNISEMMHDCVFEGIDEILERARKESFEFLKTALEVSDGI